MIALNFVSKLRFTADQSPEPGDAVVAHVLDLGLGRPRMKRAYCDDDGVWSCAASGSRSMVMGWMPGDDAQERKYRARFGL